jgi:hypothetical protein
MTHNRMQHINIVTKLHSGFVLAYETTAKKKKKMFVREIKDAVYI